MYSGVGLLHCVFCFLKVVTATLMFWIEVHFLHLNMVNMQHWDSIQHYLFHSTTNY